MTTTNGIFLIDNRKKLLITHATNAPWNQWSIPKGLSEGTERSLESAKRELLEETNIDIESIHITDYTYLGKQPYRKSKKILEGHLYKAHSNLSELSLNLKCTSLIPTSLLPECDIIKWVDIEEALPLIHETQRNLLIKYLIWQL